MRKIHYLLLLSLMVFGSIAMHAFEPQSKPKFKVLVLTERGGGHEHFVATALKWLEGFAEQHQFEFDQINNTKKINKEFLSQYKVFLQLDFPPYTWSDESKAAFKEYIEKGKGGWVGFHHATLLGDFDGYPMWQWFSDFMGGIKFKSYIAETASATIRVEDTKHPVMKNVSPSFTLHNDEWYTFDKNPRPNVHVLANVDESTYQPDSKVKMGDHPAIWVNKKVKARNVYFIMGHHGSLFDSEDFKTMLGNALLWAAKKK